MILRETINIIFTKRIKIKVVVLNDVDTVPGKFEHRCKTDLPQVSRRSPGHLVTCLKMVDQLEQLHTSVVKEAERESGDFNCDKILLVNNLGNSPQRPGHG